MRQPILYLLVFFHTLIYAQKVTETFDIKNPGIELSKKCGEYLAVYNRLPIELRYGVSVEDGYIYFYFPNEKYFNLMFDAKSDGIAVDILRQDQYRCYAKNEFANSWANRGYLMPPMYREEILENAVINEQGFVIIPYGQLPTRFDSDNVECNLLVLQKKYLCGYHNFSQIEYSNWGLLEMGLYRDSLSHQDLSDQHKLISKSLRFTIPFEKGKSDFSSSDIRPLYDSLELTDYNIKEMSIRAYTSVEGSAARNIDIQNGRANSIVQALQSYQNPEIISDISAKENWVEFMNDIKDSRFNYLTTLTKEEIKIELQKSDLLEELETTLANHRKALIVLRLQKRFSDEENNPDILKTFFNQSIERGDIQEALYLQQIIFAKIDEEKIPTEFIGTLELPKELKYGALLNNFAIFNYESGDTFLYQNVMAFEELLQILPENIKVMYNLIALKMKAWTEGEIITNGTDIKNSIDELEKAGLDKSLLTRLKVNYHIILTQYNHLASNFKEKNRSLKEVYWLYKRIDLEDKDLLSLSQYLAIYSRFDWAVEVLINRINDVDVSEELIYYYLQLTIYDPNKTKQTAYRTFMLNAIDKSNKRFCDLFLPKPQGGYTFQLLDDEFLRKTYCENCDY